MSILSPIARLASHAITPALGAAKRLGATAAARAPEVAQHAGALAASQAARPAYTGAIGAAAGLGANRALPADEQVGDITAAAGGGLTGAALGHPVTRGFLGKQLQYAARVGEQPGVVAGLAGKIPYAGRVLQPAMHNPVTNFLTKPRYPIIEPLLARAGWPGKAVAETARLTPLAAGAGGLGMGAYNAAKTFPDQVTELATSAGVDDPAVHDELRSRTWRRSPELALQTYGPGSYRDRTPVGDMQRDMFSKLVVPSARFGLHHMRTTQPRTTWLLDRMRSTTPMGLAQTAMIRRSGTSTPPNKQEIMRELFEKHRPAMTERASEVPDSPLVRNYLDLLASPSVTNNSGVKNTIGNAVADYTGLGPSNRSLSYPTGVKRQYKKLPNDVQDDVDTATRRRAVDTSTDLVNRWRDMATTPGSGRTWDKPTNPGISDFLQTDAGRQMFGRLYQHAAERASAPE